MLNTSQKTQSKNTKYWHGVDTSVTGNI